MQYILYPNLAGTRCNASECRTLKDGHFLVLFKDEQVAPCHSREMLPFKWAELKYIVYVQVICMMHDQL